jgi:hypothetical protein
MKKMRLVGWTVQPVVMVDDGENLEPVDVKGEFVPARKWDEFKNGGDERGLEPLRARLEAGGGTPAAG